MLVVFGGLPGTGKSTLAQYIARRLGGVYVRIDSIEQAIVDSGIAGQPLGPVGYAVGYAMALDNLRLGSSVVADSVNPLAVTRDAWRAVAARAGSRLLEIEVMCSDAVAHRARVESRPSTVANLRLPTWQEVVDRDYEAWDRQRIVIDTAGQTVTEACDKLSEIVDLTN